MKAITFEQPGQPEEVLRVAELPKPEPKPGEVRIRVQLCPVHPADLMFIQNLYGIRPVLPSPAGFEGVGVIDAVADGVPLKPGTRVSFTSVGAWAEYAVTPAHAVIPVPDAMPDELAAQLFVNPFTAYAMVRESGVRPGEWLMLTAAGSAFGKMVIQLCKMEGIRTIATVRRDDLAEELKTLGAEVVINTETESMTRRVMELTDNKGVPCVLEAVAGKMAASALNCLRTNGKMLVYGALSLDNIPVNAGILIFKSLTMKGFWLTHWTRHTDPAVVHEAAQKLIGLLSSGQIQLPVEAQYPLDEIHKAVAHAAAPGRHGKVMVKCH